MSGSLTVWIYSEFEGHCAVNPFGLAGGVASTAGGVPEHPIRVVVDEMLS